MSTSKDSEGFPFLEPLPELRVKVYRNLFVSEENVKIRQKESLSGQFLRTCRIVRDEALPILYGENSINHSAYFLPRKIGKSNMELIKHLLWRGEEIPRCWDTIHAQGLLTWNEVFSINVQSVEVTLEAAVSSTSRITS
jgi:hypothetical protein